MTGFGLLLGHLVGDYILQNDWQAANKTQRHWPCLIHCLLYTVSVWAFSFLWLPWWGLAICFLSHYPIDRYRLAAWWMKNISGQTHFASKEHPMFPWSVVMVDNIFHLLTLYLIALLAGIS